MRSSASLLSLVLISLLDAPVYGDADVMPRQDGGCSASGIPTVANAKDPACKPWYAIRDAIMGGIYHGRCGDLARASVRLALA
ncbi:hypothetical protein C8R44DRAFT_883201 [Mycena epipterygia]|nr:hypothetical protein C8R44DRAFT_883201 [Mycena epipterygia]